jgi:hypothetical protein
MAACSMLHFPDPILKKEKKNNIVLEGPFGANSEMQT